jgi:hypothetical protein
VFSVIQRDFYLKYYSRSYLLRECGSLQRHNDTYFFYKWNQQAEYRKNYNLSRTYLLLKKSWYFQKKKNILIPFKWKKLEISPISHANYVTLESHIKWFY